MNRCRYFKVELAAGAGYGVAKKCRFCLRKAGSTTENFTADPEATPLAIFMERQASIPLREPEKERSTERHGGNKVRVRMMSMKKGRKVNSLFPNPTFLP